MDLFRITRGIPSISADTVFSIGSFPVKNSTLLLIAILIGYTLIFALVKRRLSLVPRPWQVGLEYLVVGMYDLVTQLTGSKKISRDIFPLIGSLFLFIATANLLTLVPGLSSITYNGVSIFRTGTADFNTTFALALSMVLFINIALVYKKGFFSYLGNFFKFGDVYKGFRKGLGAGFEALINFAIGLLDIIGECAKVVSLSLRLFGNMYAGEVLAAILLGAFAYLVPATWMSLNMLAGFVQALVFGSLITAYYSLALAGEEED